MSLCQRRERPYILFVQILFTLLKALEIIVIENNNYFI